MAIEKRTSITVLVVDDHQITRTMVCEILRSIGISSIVQADNGANALVKLRETHVDLIVCDWNMPLMTGVELLRQVRKDPLFKDLPFVMLTAEAYGSNVQAAIEAGVTDYVIKPFTCQVLGEKVLHILSQRPQ